MNTVLECFGSQTDEKYTKPLLFVYAAVSPGALLQTLQDGFVLSTGLISENSSSFASFTDPAAVVVSPIVSVQLYNSALKPCSANVFFGLPKMGWGWFGMCGLANCVIFFPGVLSTRIPDLGLER